MAAWHAAYRATCTRGQLHVTQSCTQPADQSFDVFVKCYCSDSCEAFDRYRRLMTEQTTQLEQALAKDWKQWEGRVVNGEFPLHRYLGGSSHSAVFLTECVRGGAPSAAIKLISEEPGKAEQQLKNWELATGLSHPNLIALFQYGQCQLDGLQLLYVVMEGAEEDLSQILPHRAVTPLEAREMLRQIIDALGYLHGMGLVHSRIKPANIMA